MTPQNPRFEAWSDMTAKLIHGGVFQFSSVQSHLFLSPIGARTLKMPVPYTPPSVGAYTRTPSHNHPCWEWQIISLRSDDLAQTTCMWMWVMMKTCLAINRRWLVGNLSRWVLPGTVDSNVVSECHLCCPPPLPTGKVSSLDGSWGLCASRLNWKKEKTKVALACPCLFPLSRGTEWGPCKG